MAAQVSKRFVNLHNSGNRLLAGCDGIVPGFCLHDELEWFTKAGLSAVRGPSNGDHQSSPVSQTRKTPRARLTLGKSGDVVLLDADPLADIRNVRRIAAVIVRGRLIQRSEINRIISSHRRRTP